MQQSISLAFWKKCSLNMVEGARKCVHISETIACRSISLGIVRHGQALERCLRYKRFCNRQRAYAEGWRRHWSCDIVPMPAFESCGNELPCVWMIRSYIRSSVVMPSSKCTSWALNQESVSRAKDQVESSPLAAMKVYHVPSSLASETKKSYSQDDHCHLLLDHFDGR